MRNFSVSSWSTIVSSSCVRALRATAVSSVLVSAACASSGGAGGAGAGGGGGPSIGIYAVTTSPTVGQVTFAVGQGGIGGMGGLQPGGASAQNGATGLSASQHME